MQKTHVEIKFFGTRIPPKSADSFHKSSIKSNWPYFAAKFDSPAEAFEAEAARHPVFRLRALTKEE